MITFHHGKIVEFLVLGKPTKELVMYKRTKVGYK